MLAKILPTSPCTCDTTRLSPTPKSQMPFGTTHVYMAFLPFCTMWMKKNLSWTNKLLFLYFRVTESFRRLGTALWLSCPRREVSVSGVNARLSPRMTAVTKSTSQPSLATRLVWPILFAPWTDQVQVSIQDKLGLRQCWITWIVRRRLLDLLVPGSADQHNILMK